MTAAGVPIFRPATKADEEKIRRLVFSVLAEYGIEPSPKTTDADLFDIEEFYADGLFEILVDGADEIMGAYGLKRLDGRRCELRKMYLDASRRGAGYGKLLLARAIEQARSLGFARIELETASVLKEAISLYRSHGFRPIENPNLAERCDQAMALDF